MIDIIMEFNHDDNTIEITGCKVSPLPFSYFELPIGSHMSIIENWKLVLDKFLVRPMN